MLPRVHAHGPGVKIVLVEFFAELHHVPAGEGTGIIERVVIVQGEIVLLLFVDRNAELLRTAHHRRMAIGHKVEQLHRVNHRLVLKDELAGFQRFIERLPGNP